MCGSCLEGRCFKDCVELPVLDETVIAAVGVLAMELCRGVLCLLVLVLLSLSSRICGSTVKAVMRPFGLSRPLTMSRSRASPKSISVPLPAE